MYASSEVHAHIQTEINPEAFEVNCSLTSVKFPLPKAVSPTWVIIFVAASALTPSVK